MKVSYYGDLFKIQHNDVVPVKGRILIAEPFSKDLYFKRSVVFLVEHTGDGTVGFILNKNIEFPIHDIVKDFPEFDAMISIGGPVMPDTLHYVHTKGAIVPGSMHIADNLWWGGNFDAIKALITEGVIKKNDIRFFIGYSGWSPNQLDEEINRDNWIVTKLDERVIMNETDDIWRESLSKQEDRYRLWVNFPESPSLN